MRFLILRAGTYLGAESCHRNAVCQSNFYKNRFCTCFFFQNFGCGAKNLVQKGSFYCSGGAQKRNFNHNFPPIMGLFDFFQTNLNYSETFLLIDEEYISQEASYPAQQNPRRAKSPKICVKCLKFVFT